MSKTATRRFTLVDLMPLIAATALGLALARTIAVYGTSNYANTFEWFPVREPMPIVFESGSPERAVASPTQTWAERLNNFIDSSTDPPAIVGAGVPCLVCWTVTVLLLRLRSPRPGLRRLARQPGFAASSAAVLVISVRAVGAGLSALSWSLPALDAQAFRMAFFEYPIAYRLWSLLLYPFPFAAPGEIGLAIGSVWLNLWLSGRWRVERSWVDRLGRTLAILWLMLVPLLYWWCGLTRWAH
jgi:hypothetical protein